MINLEINMKIKKIFVNFMILLLGNFQDFISTDVKIFDNISFINKIPLNNRSFYKKFTQTQMFNTFIKDYNESTAFQIKEFKNYLSIIFNEKQKESQAEDIQKERNSIRKSSNSGELLIQESDCVHEKKFKFKALAFKQNLEIQNMIGLFKDDSDSEESFEETASSSIIRINFLDQSMAYIHKQAEDYQTNMDIRIEVDDMSSNKTKPSSFGFSSAFMHYQRRNRCDSGKLDSKDSRESSHYEKEILKNRNTAIK